MGNLIVTEVIEILLDISSVSISSTDLQPNNKSNTIAIEFTGIDSTSLWFIS